MAKASESSQGDDPRKDGEDRKDEARRSESAGAVVEHGGGGKRVASRRGQYLVAPRRASELQVMGLQPLQFSMLEDTLRNSPDVEVIDTVGARNIVGALADGLGDGPGGVLVVRMEDDKAATLQQQAQGRLIVEHDQSLSLLDTTSSLPNMVTGAVAHAGPALSVNVTVLGRDDKPVPDAEVYLFGSLLPATATTDQRGQAQLTLYGESESSVRGLYVKPKADYWSFYQAQPALTTSEPNVVGLRPISDWPSLAAFPGQQTYGWGQKAMRLDQLPAEYRGQGIRVAVIDSGTDNRHRDLGKIRFGFDIINKRTNPDTWNEDLIAHGSHCAGTIAGADNGRGIRGFAPDAEIHACKLFPGGQVSQLIDALEYCIEKQIDIVNLSLGGAQPSEALEQQIIRARRAGVACIAAAGNSGNRVQYPASSPNVLAVAAIGRLNEFPPDSYHMQTLTQPVDRSGVYAARFSCFGPEVAVCAPGVAVTSSVPPDNYAVWDGTSMAAPHIAGLAAFILAHHPDFQGAFGARGPERVERLFQIIRYSARALANVDPARVGYGLPDVLVALGLQPHPSTQMIPQAAMAPAFFGGPAFGGGWPAVSPGAP
ncbi:MAG TPA: S8 family serine peptidase, partial [Noviherbaspirillum sp.]|nr:S8 family serine peptidase [Noviherbaspirillum sp.]